MTPVEKAGMLFKKAGLGFPALPAMLGARLRERGDWLFSTREIEKAPYNLHHYLREDPVGDYLILSHSGYGANSYAIQYYLVYGPLQMFLHLAWGGIYSNDRESAAQDIRLCFSLADEVVRLTRDRQKLKPGQNQRIVGSDIYNSYWSLSGNGGERRSLTPAGALGEVLQWLKDGTPDQK